MLGGQQADQTLYTLITSVEVEESMDMPAAIQMCVPISRSNGGDLTYVDDPRFAPLATVAVVATAGGSGATGVATGAVGAAAAAVGGGSAPPGTQCIFDGYVLSQKIHLETGATNATMTVWGQDACWLMNQTETVKEWVDVTDADVAASIFGDYGITPGLRQLAERLALAHRGHPQPDAARLGHRLPAHAGRRSGKCCRVACADTPGQRTGYFAVPNLDGDPAVDHHAERLQQLDGQRARPGVGRHAADRGHRPQRAVQRQRPERRSRRFHQLRPHRARRPRPRHLRRLSR